MLMQVMRLRSSIFFVATLLYSRPGQRGRVVMNATHLLLYPSHQHFYCSVELNKAVTRRLLLFQEHDILKQTVDTCTFFKNCVYKRFDRSDHYENVWCLSWSMHLYLYLIIRSIPQGRLKCAIFFITRHNERERQRERKRKEWEKNE